ncbi:MAG: PilZ domain-containing protein [Candidatus Omnitrophota bacterium]
MAGIEKRKERRIKISLPIRVVYQGGEFKGVTGNISRLGTYAQIQKEIPVGAEVGVVLTITSAGRDSCAKDELRCNGNIFRADLARELNGKRYYGLGIFFTGFPEEKDRERLSDYVRYLISREEKAIKDGVKEWKRKKRMRHAEKPSSGAAGEADGNSEVVGLLKEILSRLEEIRSFLKASASNK